MKNKNSIGTFYRIYKNLFRGIILVSTILVFVYLIGDKNENNIKETYKIGKPWNQADLFAPNDFAINKSKNRLTRERALIEKNSAPIFEKITIELKKNYQNKQTPIILQNIYNKGLIENISTLANKDSIFIKKSSLVVKHSSKEYLTLSTVKSFVEKQLSKQALSTKQKKNINFEILSQIKPNIIYRDDWTKIMLQSKYKKIAPVYGFVEKGSRIISKGDIIDKSNIDKIKTIYSLSMKDQNNSIWQYISYFSFVTLLIGLLYLYIMRYRKNIFVELSDLSLLFFSLVLNAIFLKFFISLGSQYIYIAPLAILPFIIKAFFDFRLAIVAHIVNIILLSFISKSPSEFMILHIVGGFIVILSKDEYYKRSNMFINIFRLIGTYIFVELTFSIGNSIFDFEDFLIKSIMYTANGLLCLFVLPLIFIIEKFFKKTSDVSLLEWTDTNNKILQTLSVKAPGSFQHSLQVASLSEIICQKIGGNTLLVRAGALYHDIGKLDNPEYFTENQQGNHSLHQNLSPLESAQIIINHVKNGLEIGKKNKLPDEILDFIRTHHGTSTVLYFWNKYKETLSADLRKEEVESHALKFKYKGPLPFSIETAVVMICDSIEAASRSIKNASEEKYTQIIDFIINRLIDENQLVNTPISLADIQVIKKILLKRLIKINHLRIMYPNTIKEKQVK